MQIGYKLLAVIRPRTVNGGGKKDVNCVGDSPT